MLYGVGVAGTTRQPSGSECEMKEVLLTAAIGVAAGTIDVVPMITMRLDN